MSDHSEQCVSDWQFWSMHSSSARRKCGMKNSGKRNLHLLNSSVIDGEFSVDR